MDRYSLYDHHQKRMDAIVERFQKAATLAILVCLTTPWAILSGSSELQEIRLSAAGLIMAFAMILLSTFSHRAQKSCREIREDFERDFAEHFDGISPPKLIGMFTLR